MAKEGSTRSGKASQTTPGIQAVINRILPFLKWFENYSFTSLRSDFLAGLTVALVLIPQSMAYAQLADLPAYYGLYAAFLPPIIASLFGSSNQLATGPVAVVSLMTSTALAPLATAGSEMFIAYAILLALIVGLFQLTLGVLRLGLVVNFLSHPVVNGFTNAAALIIATSQLSKLFGVDVDKAEHHYETVYHVILAAIDSTHIPTLLLAILAISMMIVLKKINPKIPNVLIAVVVTTVISWAIGFENNVNCPVSQIKDTEISAAILQYNQNLGNIETYSDKRIYISKKYKSLQKNSHHPTEEILNLKHEEAVINLHLSEIKEQTSVLRAKIRKAKFAAVTDAQGKTEFYLKNKTGQPQSKSKRTWKLKVGNRALNADALLLRGGGVVVGNIPSGLPKLSVPKIDFSIMLDLFSMAIIISLLGFMEAISIAKAMAAKTGQRLDPNQELIGQGLSNIVGSFGQSYPVSGSFSRSAVNIQAGAVSGLSNVFSSMVVLLTLLFFTPLLYHLPQSVLASIIMMAVVGLINVKGFIHSWQAQKYDGVISIISFVFTLAFAPHLDKGIVIGVVLSLGLFLLRNIKPDMAILSRYSDGTYRNSDRRHLKICRHIAVVRFNNSLFFANVNYLEDEILDLMSNMKELHHIHIVGNGINELDASGEETLAKLIDRIREVGLDISFSGLNDHVLDVFRRTHLLEKLGETHIFGNVQFAVRHYYEKTHKNSSETECPLINVRYKGLKVTQEMADSLAKEHPWPKKPEDTEVNEDT